MVGRLCAVSLKAELGLDGHNGLSTEPSDPYLPIENAFRQSRVHPNGHYGPLPPPTEGMTLHSYGTADGTNDYDFRHTFRTLAR